ncbi:hypothetical protein AAMO2058_001249600, partial [Amorphochlora amoebiformis]
GVFLPLSGWWPGIPAFMAGGPLGYGRDQRLTLASRERAKIQEDITVKYRERSKETKYGST